MATKSKKSKTVPKKKPAKPKKSRRSFVDLIGAWEGLNSELETLTEAKDRCVKAIKAIEKEILDVAFVGKSNHICAIFDDQCYGMSRFNWEVEGKKPSYEIQIEKYKCIDLD